jgi:predicted RND superfamily exporter protein
VDRLAGINHNQVFSLASERVGFADAVPGAIVSHPFMFPGVPRTSEEIGRLKLEMAAHRNRLRHLVSDDNRAAAVTAAFNENDFDSRALFDDIQRLVTRYQDGATRVYAAGEPVVRGYGYYYMPIFTAIFITCVAVMAAILFLTLGYSTGWWTPLLTGSLSAIWGLGFVGMMHYDFDPVMLVIPFILTARDISHGIQWQGRYFDEVTRPRDKHAALVATTGHMFPPGLLSILADIAGVVFISFGGIPALHRIALAGAVWLAGSLTMVFIFQPILMSFMAMPRPRVVGRRWAAVKRHGQELIDRLALFAATPGIGRDLLLAGALVVIVWGIASGLRQRVGYQQPGTPLYPSRARINQDIASISDIFPLIRPG